MVVFCRRFQALIQLRVFSTTEVPPPPASATANLQAAIMDIGEYDVAMSEMRQYPA